MELLHKDSIISLGKLRLLGLLVIFSLFVSVSIVRASLRVTDVSETSITVRWRDYGDSSYSVFYYRSPGGEDQTYAGDTGGTRFKITGLRPNTKYYITVFYSGGSLTTRATTEASDKPVIARPRDITCPLLPASVMVSGYGENTQCKQVGAAGVANPELMAQGILDAVDIFGKVDAELRVCFRQHGRLKFLDSTTMPHRESDLAAEYIDGITCGRIDRIGTVVLLEVSEAPAEGEAEPAPVPAATEAVGLDNCQLRTTDYLSLRGGPSTNYARLDIIPRGTRLTARARSSDWYIVDFEAIRGWISGEYTEASPGCEGIEGSTRVFLLMVTEPSGEAEAETMAPPERGDADAALAEPEPPFDCRLKTGDIINLRLSPGLENEILAEIPFKAELIATERAGDWFEVEYEGILGWVNIDYVFRSGYCG